VRLFIRVELRDLHRLPSRSREVELRAARPQQQNPPRSRQPETVLRVATYTRRSTDDEHQQHTIEAQTQRLSCSMRVFDLSVSIGPTRPP
jgi:hypothetical protein